MGNHEPPDDYPDIPAPFIRDANNRAEFMNMSAVSEDQAPKAKAKPAPSKSKANGADKPVAKAADKPKAKPAKVKAKAETAPKAKAKASKGSEKPKAAKPKAEAAKKDAFGFREGSAKSKAVALYAAKKGATLEEVKDAVGSVQLNVLNALEEDGHTVERKKEEREGARSVTRYFLKAKK
jgi:hypothetical protein